MKNTDTGKKLTLSVIEAGKRLGIGRNQAYEAVHRGDIPTIKLGKRILVPIAALERMLNATYQGDHGAAE